MIGSGYLAIVLFTLNALSALIFFILALVFFTRHVMNIFFILFLLDAAIVTLAFSFDYDFIQALRGDGDSKLVFSLISFCLLIMIPLYYLSVRKYTEHFFKTQDLPLLISGLLILAFSLVVGWPPALPLFRWLRWFPLHSLLLLLISFSLRDLLRHGKHTREAAPVASETKTLFLMGAILLAMTAVSGFVELIDHRSELRLVSITMSGSLFVFLLYLLSRSPDLLRQSGIKYANSILDKEASANLFFRADQLIREERLFRNFGFSLSDLAKSMKVNVRYLSQAINQNTHKNFSSFINAYRLEEARKLLMETEENATDIGYSVGFNSLSSFYDQFKKVEGRTPEQFRKKK